MFLTKQEESSARIDDINYYTRTLVENEFRERSDKRAFECEVKRRMNKHLENKNAILEERRGRLLDLMNCENRLYEELCRQKLAELKQSEKDALYAAAENAEKLLKEREMEIAKQKLAQRDMLQNAPIREHMHKLHEVAIAKDREYLERLKKQDESEQAKLDKYLESMSSHFEEQLIKEEQEREKKLDTIRIIAKDNLDEVARRKKYEAEERDRDKTRWKGNSGLLIGERENGSGMPPKFAPMTLEERLADVDRARRNREANERIETTAEKFCYPDIKSEDKNQLNEDMKRRREEMLQFMEYQRKMKQYDDCSEKYLDRLYMKEAEDRNRKHREQCRAERVRSLNVAKEIMAEQKKIIEQKNQERSLIRQKLAEERQMQLEQLEKYVQEVKAKEADRIEKQKKFNEEVRKLMSRRDEIKAKLREEVERETHAMLLAEEQYQESIRRAMESNPLTPHLHPWRKP